MFLQQLNRSEQQAFLELAVTIANANGIFDEKERLMIESYKLEMDFDTDISTLDLRPIQELMNAFQKRKVQRIVFLESIAIAFADGIYHEEQKSHIHKLKQEFNISDVDYESFKTWISKMNMLYVQAVELIDD